MGKRANKIKYQLTGIDIWGTNKVKKENIEKKLQIKIGNFYSVSEIKRISKKVTELFKKSKQPKFSSVMMPRYKKENITCLTIDFVGKNNLVVNKLRLQPTKHIKIPKRIIDVYDRYQKEIGKCFDYPKRSVGKIFEDGFYFSEDKQLRLYEEKFIKIAKSDYELLLDVAYNHRLASIRAMAFYILGWYPDKKKMIEILHDGFYDSDFQVQNNAAILMIPIVEMALKTKKFKVPIEPVLDLIRMPSGLSRNKAISILFQYVMASKHLSVIKKQAGGIIKKMAKSKQLNHKCFAVPIKEKLRI